MQSRTALQYSNVFYLKLGLSVNFVTGGSTSLAGWVVGPLHIHTRPVEKCAYQPADSREDVPRREWAKSPHHFCHTLYPTLHSQTAEGKLRMGYDARPQFRVFASRNRITPNSLLLLLCNLLRSTMTTVLPVSADW